MLLDYHSAYYATAVVELEAAVEARAEASASLRVERRLSAQVTSAASALATLRVTRPLAASVAAQASVSATLHVTRGLSAAVSAQAGASTTLTVTRRLAASVAAQAGVVATLRSGVPAPDGGVLTLSLPADVATLDVAEDAATLTLAADVASLTVTDDVAALSVAADVTTLEFEMTYVKVEADTLPLLTATLKRNGVAVSIAGATAVLRWAVGGLTGTLSGTVTDGPGGVCEFDLTALPAGRGRAEVFATFADAETRTFPSADAVTITVRPHL